MSDLQALEKNLVTGLRDGGHTLNSAFEEIRSWSTDGKHSQKQIQQDLQTLTNDLHKKGLLSDLQIDGVDKQGNLVTEDINHHKVLIDGAGMRSDAREMANHALDVLHSGDKNCGQQYIEQIKAIYARERQIPQGEEHARFDDQIGHWMKARSNQVRLIPNGENMRHGANAIR